MNEELRMHAENIALFIRSDANQDQTERVYEWLKKYPKALEEIRSMPAKSKQDKAMLIMGAVITGRGFNEYCEIIKIKHDVIPVSEPNIEIIGDAFSDYIKENNLNYSNNDDSFGDAFGLFYAGVEWLLKCQKAKK